MTPINRLQRQMVAALKAHLVSDARPNIPEAGRLLWGFFVDLSGTRTYHPAGPNPISYSEIEAYARLVRLPLQAHHIDIIRALDRAWLDHAAKRDTTGLTAVPPTARRGKTTAAMFDAMYG